MQLNHLAIKYNTDKSSLFHNYAEIYDLFFRNLKNQTVNLLEIGVALGNSLRMWKEYFTNQNIFGIDINPECKKFEEDRIKIYIGKQKDKSFLKRVIDDIKKIDIIIDDGSHIIDHQIKSFTVLFPELKENGFYLIEDLHSSYSPNPVFRNKNYTTIDFLKDRINDIQFNGKNVHDLWHGYKKNHYRKKHMVKPIKRNSCFGEIPLLFLLVFIIK